MAPPRAAGGALRGVLRGATRKGDRVPRPDARLLPRGRAARGTALPPQASGGAADRASERARQAHQRAGVHLRRFAAGAATRPLGAVPARVALYASRVPGFLIMALAVVNAIPDYHQDRLVGKAQPRRAPRTPARSASLRRPRGCRPGGRRNRCHRGRSSPPCAALCPATWSRCASSPVASCGRYELHRSPAGAGIVAAHPRLRPLLPLLLHRVPHSGKSWGTSSTNPRRLVADIVG